MTPAAKLLLIAMAQAISELEAQGKSENAHKLNNAVFHVRGMLKIFIEECKNEQ